jgi:hypothetical protein
MAFVKMSASAQNENRRSSEMAKMDFPRVTADGWLGETGDGGTGDFPVHAQLGQEVVKSAAQHEGQGGTEPGDLFEARGGGFWVRQSHRAHI